MTEPDFNFGLKPRRPLWKDVCLFCLTVGFVWGGTHVFMNYDAFASIAVFKADKFQASILKKWDNFKNPPKKIPLKLKKVKTVRRAIFRNKTLKPRNQAKNLFVAMPLYPSDNRIYIPSINKNVPLVTVPNHKHWEQLETNIQKGLQNGVVVHPISHSPGTVGNFFLTGHSSYYKWDKGRFKDVFALLHEVEPGEKVEVYWKGRKFVYKIREKGIVLPTATEVLNQPKDRSIITLMTCTPVGTNKKRLILIGDLVEDKI